jgi:uncharacterized protein (DUF4415 family)
MKTLLPDITDEREAQIQRMIASDPDNPEATDEELASMRPFKEVFPDLYASMQREFIVEELPPMREVSIELEETVIEKYKATGLDWQMLVNDVLKRAKI